MRKIIRLIFLRIKIWFGLNFLGWKINANNINRALVEMGYKCEYKLIKNGYQRTYKKYGCGAVVVTFTKVER